MLTSTFISGSIYRTRTNTEGKKKRLTYVKFTNLICSLPREFFYRYVYKASTRIFIHVREAADSLVSIEKPFTLLGRNSLFFRYTDMQFFVETIFIAEYATHFLPRCYTPTVPKLPGEIQGCHTLDVSFKPSLNPHLISFFIPY